MRGFPKKTATLITLSLLAGVVWWQLVGKYPGVRLTSRPNLSEANISGPDFQKIVELHNECFDPDKRKYFYDYLVTIGYPDANAKIHHLLKDRVESFVQEGHAAKLSYMRGNKNVTWLSSDEGILGMYDCRIEEEITGGSVMIFNLCVGKKYRGMGYGARLVRDAIRRCYRSGMRLTLSVYEGNARAISMYESYGFKKIPLAREPLDRFLMYRKYLMEYQPTASENQ